jgi:hypothetical protein
MTMAERFRILKMLKGSALLSACGFMLAKSDGTSATPQAVTFDVSVLFRLDSVFTKPVGFRRSFHQQR